jgi:hypothetical protein
MNTSLNVPQKNFMIFFKDQQQIQVLEFSEKCLGNLVDLDEWVLVSSSQLRLGQREENYIGNRFDQLKCQHLPSL